MCQFAKCGDGYVNREAAEVCDNPGGSDTATCNGNNAGFAMCRIPSCGDDYINRQAGEDCESSIHCLGGKICDDCQCR